MPSESNTTTHDNWTVTRTYAWGGNMDHEFSTARCRTCGYTLHSDFDSPEDDELDVHDTGECYRLESNAAQAAAALVSLAGLACEASYAWDVEENIGMWVFFFPRKFTPEEIAAFDNEPF